MDELIKLDQVDEITLNIEPADEIDLDLGEVLGVVRPPELEKVEVTPTKETQVIKPSKFGTYIEETKVYPIPDEYADISNVDATAEDVLNGKTFVDNQGNKVQGTAELKEDLDAELTAQDEAIARLTIAIDDLPTPKCSCGSIGTGDYYVKVIDYDGTILAEKRLNNGDTYTLPNAPSHDGLVFQEWSCSQEIVDGVITIANNNVMVGATYTTASGLSEFDITLTKATGLDVTLKMDGTKNWGDGTSDDLTTHTYTNYGDYTITCNGTTMTASSTSALFGQKSSLPNHYCNSVRLAEGVKTINIYTFTYCYSLKSIVLPRGVTKLGSYALNNCKALKSIVLPRSVTDISSTNTFDYSYLLTSIVIPPSVTSIGNGNLGYCYSLKSVAIPQNCRIGGTVFQGCYSITELVIPQGTSSFYNTFDGCYSLTKYDFTQFTTIPSLSSTSTLSSINKLCKIYVPDDLYDEWIVATNWVTYADYIYKASEMEA